LLSGKNQIYYCEKQSLAGFQRGQNLFCHGHQHNKTEVVVTIERTNLEIVRCFVQIFGHDQELLENLVRVEKPDRQSERASHRPGGDA